MIQHVAAAEHVGAAAGGDIEGFAGAHGGRVFIAYAGRKHGLTSFDPAAVDPSAVG